MLLGIPYVASVVATTKLQAFRLAEDQVCTYRSFCTHCSLMQSFVQVLDIMQNFPLVSDHLWKAASTVLIGVHLR